MGRRRQQQTFKGESKGRERERERQKSQTKPKIIKGQSHEAPGRLSNIMTSQKQAKKAQKIGIKITILCFTFDLSFFSLKIVDFFFVARFTDFF
jgi:hypothetical protein